MNKNKIDIYVHVKKKPSWISMYLNSAELCLPMTANNEKQIIYQQCTKTVCDQHTHSIRSKKLS